MNKPKQDTRNRHQKLYDLQYRDKIEAQPYDKRTQENTPELSISEAQEYIRRKGNTNIDHYEKLLIRNGYSYKHPRTHERIIGHYKSTREDRRLIQKLQPCVTYHQQVNRTRGVKFKKGGNLRGKIEKWLKGDKRVKATTTIGHKTGQFKTVWYSGNMRRK